MEYLPANRIYHLKCYRFWARNNSRTVVHNVGGLSILIFLYLNVLYTFVSYKWFFGSYILLARVLLFQKYPELKLCWRFGILRSGRTSVFLCMNVGMLTNCLKTNMNSFGDLDKILHCLHSPFTRSTWWKQFLKEYF